MKSKIILDLRLYHKYTGIGLVSRKIYDFLEKDKINLIVISGNHEIDFLDKSVINYKIKGVFGIINFLKVYLLLLKIKPKYVIFPHYFVNPLIPKSVKVIAFVHDIMAISHKYQFWKVFPNLKAFILKTYLQFVLKNSDLIVPSYTVKKELLSYFNLNSVVIPNGSDFKFIQVNRQHNFLFVGNNRKHKNLSFLLKIFSELKSYLIVVNSEIKSTKDNVVIKSRINENELKNLYSTSTALIIPSFCEGFGIPIIDSIKLQTKVFASKIDVFKEFYGLNITYFDPKNSYELTTLIELYNKSLFFGSFSTNADSLNIFNWSELNFYFNKLA